MGHNIWLSEHEVVSCAQFCVIAYICVGPNCYRDVSQYMQLQYAHRDVVPAVSGMPIYVTAIIALEYVWPSRYVLTFRSWVHILCTRCFSYGRWTTMDPAFDITRPLEVQPGMRVSACTYLYATLF